MFCNRVILLQLDASNPQLMETPFPHGVEVLYSIPTGGIRVQIRTRIISTHRRHFPEPDKVSEGVQLLSLMMPPEFRKSELPPWLVLVRGRDSEAFKGQTQNGSHGDIFFPKP